MYAQWLVSANMHDVILPVHTMDGFGSISRAVTRAYTLLTDSIKGKSWSFRAPAMSRVCPNFLANYHFT